MHLNLFKLLITFCDAPQPWGLYFQDSASPQMEALVELHDNIMFYLVIILFGVAWIMVSIIRNYVVNKSPISNKYLNHGTLIELIWTITPALILILIAFASFKLLYLMDEVTDPSLTIFVEGNQWYWSYQYPDFTNDGYEDLELDFYLIPECNLWKRQLAPLGVDNNAALPLYTEAIPTMLSDNVYLEYSNNAIGNAQASYSNSVANYFRGNSTSETVDNKYTIFLARLATRIERSVDIVGNTLRANGGYHTPESLQTYSILMQDRNAWIQVNSTRSTICLPKIKWNDVK